MFSKHVCTVIYGSQSCLPLLPENPTCWERFIRVFRKTTLVSPSNPICKIYFKSNAAITFERRRHVETNLLHIIHPFSTFRTYWELWMMLVFLASLIYNPLYVAFHSTESGIQVEITVIDILCIFDIVLTFFTGYGINSTKEVILDPGRIARRYLCSYFLLDLLSSFPIDLLKLILGNIVDMSDPHWKLIGVLSLLKIFRFHTLIIYMSRAADMWQISLLHFLAFRYTVILLLVIHWATCLQYAIPNAIGLLNGSLSPNSWIIKSGINNYTSHYNRYLRCLFRACCFLLNITHGPYHLLTVEDILIAVLSLLVGTILSALLLVLILQIVTSVVSAETKYQEIMNQVQEYMGYKQLPINMQRRLIAFYEYKFQKSYFREGAITATLSERLRREINVFCYRRLVDSVSIFKDMPQHIIVDIVNSLKPEIFLPNDIIVKAGTIGECMYFLASGTVCVVTPTGREVCHLYDGAYFGEIALIMKDQKRIANVIAIEICEVYRLDRKNFKTCFVNNVELFRKVEKIAQDRRERTLMLEELHKKYLMAMEMPNMWGLDQ